MSRRSQILCIAAGSLVSSSVLAQPCSPDWNTTVGNPGVSGGYVAPIAAWNDGNGEALFVGGSFTRAGNNATADYLAKWDRSTSTWSALGTGISPGNTNAFMTCIVPFDPGDGERLVVGGWFARAGSVVESASLAMWNGSAWESLGTGWYYNSGTDSRRGAVWAATAWNNRLYVGGGIFPDGGTIPAGAIASWNGLTWVSEASTLTSISNNPTVFALQVFDDGTGPALYAAGRFDTINGVPATGIARQTESGWAAVGSPFTSMSAFAGLNTLAVFDDGSGPALYAAGTGYRLAGQPPPGGYIAAQVIRWDGTSWTQAGQWVGTGAVQSLAVFDDGNGPGLYFGGQALPDIGYFCKLVGDAWVTVGGGFTAVSPPWPGVFGLGAWGDSLYVGGIFTDLEGPAATNIVAWRACTTCLGDIDRDGRRTLQDLAFLLANFGTPSGATADDGDLDGDADVDLQDLADLLAVFGLSC